MNAELTQPVGSRDRQFRGIFSGVPLIIAAVLLSTGGLALALNESCKANFRASLLIYPNAALVREESEFLGAQRALYRTHDPLSRVRSWYQRQRAGAMRRAVVSGDFSHVPPERWVITADGGGTLIAFSASCAWNDGEAQTPPRRVRQSVLEEFLGRRITLD